MKRQLHLLSDTTFDVVVVGGGIHGAAIACEAARSGLTTALIEQNDFGHATSANSLKVLHGGLRYLQHLNFKRMRESIGSRRDMLRIAPHLARPLPCLMPTYGYGLRSKPALRMALLANDVISWDRNRGVDPERHIPAGKIISKEECVNLIPSVHENGLTGAALWHDAIALDSERLTLAFVAEAVAQGALAANYLKATELLLRQGRACGVQVQDCLTAETFAISARWVVSAMGPWLGGLRGEPETKRPWALGMNVVVKRSLFQDHAVGLEGTAEYVDKDAVFKRGKRLFFFVPWRGHTLIGTHYVPYHDTPDQLNVRPGYIEEFLNEVNAVHPPAQLSFDDITFVHAGLLPAAAWAEETCRNVQLQKHTAIVDHVERDGLASFLSVDGVKYTTAPRIARAVVKRILRQDGDRAARPPASDNTPTQPASDVSDCAPPVHEHLRRTYGPESGTVARYCAGDREDPGWISTAPPLLPGEIVYYVREEMALTLSDIVLRRSNLGSAECPPESVLRHAAAVAGEELGWTADKKEQEIREVQQRYALLTDLQTLNNES